MAPTREVLCFAEAQSTVANTLLLSVLFGRETLKQEEQEKKQLSHPAHFGPRKYCLRECICEVEGQVPCPALVPLPKEMTGKYKATLKASAQD